MLLTHRFYPFTGGIEVNSEILATQFHEAGHQVRVVTWTIEKGEKSFEFDVLRSPSKVELIKSHKWADVVFENNPSIQLSWPLILFFNKVNVVAIRTLINRPSGKLGWKDKFKIWRLRSANKVIAVSTPIRDVCWPKAVVIPNPFRRNLFRVIPESSRQKSFVFLGRLVSQKRCDLNIKLINRLRSSHPSLAYLSVIGNGPEMDSLKELVAEYDLTDRVKFLGEMHGEALIQELNLYKYILIPSDFEAFGNVALEGIACGNLPIVSDSGGLLDAIGKAGISFTSSSIDSFYEQTVKLLENPDLEKELRSYGESHLDNHIPEKIGQRYLDVLETAYSLAHPKKSSKHVSK